VHLQESAICTSNGYKKTNGGVRRKLDTPLVIKGGRGQHRNLLGYVLSCPHIIRRGDDMSLLLCTRKRKLVRELTQREIHNRTVSVLTIKERR